MGGRRITPLTETGIVAELLRSRRGTGAALSAVQVPNPAKDTFTVAATPATTYTLTYLPLEQSVNLSLNGIELLEGTDYTLDYATAIATISADLVT
ncbi:MAG TPA: hypothetical protein VN088_08565, partial [Nocardioides sp.]|nr:hypothetical protein [Nocardioides sp.]